MLCSAIVFIWYIYFGYLLAYFQWMKLRTSFRVLIRIGETDVLSNMIYVPFTRMDEHNATSQLIKKYPSNLAPLTLTSLTPK